MYVCFEVDSYGHFFRKAKTKLTDGIEPHWNQDFIIELEGSQTLRILCYEDHPKLGVQLRGKTHLEVGTTFVLNLVLHLLDCVCFVYVLYLPLSIRHLHSFRGSQPLKAMQDILKVSMGSRDEGGHEYASWNIRLTLFFKFQLSRSWLNDTLTERRVSLQDLVLVLSLKFLPPEATLRRVPTGKSSGLFGANIAHISRWVGAWFFSVYCG